MDALIDELIDKFGYQDLEANALIHRAAEELIALRNTVEELEAEVARLKKLAYG